MCRREVRQVQSIVVYMLFRAAAYSVDAVCGVTIQDLLMP